MKLKTKYAERMRDELEGVLGCPVEVVEDREAKYPCKMMTKPDQDCHISCFIKHQK